MCCDGPLNPPNASRSDIPSVWEKRASNHPLAASATPMTTLWPRPLTASTKLRSSGGVVHVKPWKRSSWKPSKWVVWYNNSSLFGPIGYTTPRRSRGGVLCKLEHTRYGRVTRANWSPENSGPFRVRLTPPLTRLRSLPSDHWAKPNS